MPSPPPSWLLRALGVSALGLVLYLGVLPRLRKRLTRVKNRAIANYVNGTINKLFLQPGCAAEVGTIRVDGADLKYFKNAPKTLAELYARAAEFRDKEFLVFTGKPDTPPTRWTYGETARRVEALQRTLRAKGIKKGDRVAILMSNIPEFGVAFMAVTGMGAIAVTLNAFWEGAELEFGLTDSSSSLLLTDEKRLMRLVLPENRLETLVRNAGLKVCVVRPSKTLVDSFPGMGVFEEWSDPKHVEQATFAAPDPSLSPFDDAYIMYTSGTTSGRSKGVVHTHISSVQAAMCYQLYVEVVKVLRAGKPFSPRVDLVVSPLFHTAALIPSFLLAFFGGHKLVMLPRWDADVAMKACLEEKVTYFGAMPTMLNDVLKSRVFLENRDKFLFANIGTGGAATPSELIRRLSKTIPSVSQGSGWGLTESNSIGTIIGGPEYLEIPGSCGKPHPIADVKLIDPDTLEDVVGTNKPGEMVIRTISNMRGYWNNEADTKAVMLPGNWVRSGDLGRVDEEGFHFVIDRIKDIVIRGGENIACAEVEDCVYSIPGALVLEASAFGLPHERLGEQLAVAVTTHPGKSITQEQVIAHCEANLAKFKIPSIVFVRTNALPRGATGKILKRQLREEYKSAAAATSN